MDESFVIHTPLMWLNKAETWALADELGVFNDVREKTLTCYHGIKADGCGKCPACKLRLQGLHTYLQNKTEYGWYFCIDGNQIIGGMGVIENDFHDRKDLTPNVCAVYTEESYRKQGIAGVLLNMVVDDLKSKGISPVYLVTDHTGFYERYGWKFYCMVQGDGEPDMTRLYIHR